MSIPRNHHFVPQGYLKRFVLPDKTVHYAWKETKFISDTSAKKLCSEVDGYKLFSVPPEEALALDISYKKLWEDHYNEVHSALINDDVVVIDDRLRQLIIGTVCSLHFRSQRLKNSINSFKRRSIESMVTMRRRDGTQPEGFVLDGRTFLLEGKTADELWAEYQTPTADDGILMTYFALGVKLQELRSRDAISVTCVHGTSGFLASDNPVRIHSSSAGIVAPFNNTDLLSLPINEKYRIELVPGIKAAEPHLIHRTHLFGQEAADEVFDNNSRQFAEADRLILGRRAVLESFLAIGSA